MTLVNLFFFAHQPVRLSPYHLRPDAPRTPDTILPALFDDELNASIFRKVAYKCYYPATRLMLELLEASGDQPRPFKIAYGLSGTFLEQAELYEPELIRIFQRLAATGHVEFTAETFFHSLSSLWDDRRLEFRRQVELHRAKIRALFGQDPTIFRNTECLYNNGIAAAVQELGFAGILTEGIDWVMEGWRSPDFLYASQGGLPVLMRNYRFSDDLGYRFPNTSWEHYPLTTEKFAGWMAANTDEIVNLMLDYEAIGEHIWSEKGIFEFMRHLPTAVLRFPQLSFATPSEAVARLKPRGKINVGPFATISWADQERDTSAWLGNEMQRFCFEELRALEPLILRAAVPEYTRAWRLLQTSDHVYYLSDKSLSDGDVHTYFSAYGSLFESFVRLQTAIADLKYAVLSHLERYPTADPTPDQLPAASHPSTPAATKTGQPPTTATSPPAAQTGQPPADTTPSTATKTGQPPTTSTSTPAAQPSTPAAQPATPSAQPATPSAPPSLAAPGVAHTAPQPSAPGVAHTAPQPSAPDAPLAPVNPATVGPPAATDSPPRITRVFGPPAPPRP